MFFDRTVPHVFREYPIAPIDMAATVHRQKQAAENRVSRTDALRAYAIHASHDQTRVIVVEAWRDSASYRNDLDATEPAARLYTWAGTGGVEPTPVDDPGAGIIVIDIFPLWRPLVYPVSLFNLKNGETFNRQPGCISTTVLRGCGVGSIATYARWRTLDDFYAAFEVSTKKAVSRTDDINAAAAKMTFGVVRPDYHSYELVEYRGEPR
jgi:heme-degrading monooxygenase HmoA